MKQVHIENIFKVKTLHYSLFIVDLNENIHEMLYS